MASSQILPELLTVKEAAQMLHVSPRTLARWSATGRVPKPVKIGPSRTGAVRYRRFELSAWIVDGCQPVGGDA